MGAADLMGTTVAPVPTRDHGVGGATVTVWLVLVATTVLGAALAVVDPGLTPSTPPHPVLQPTAGAILSIVATNARVLAAPFILVVFRFNRTRWSRLLGDAIVIALLAGNAIRVGFAIGGWGIELLPYIPQLPIEYLAASVAAGVWITARPNAAKSWPVALGLLTILLLVLAASAEVLLTPHARA